MLSRKELLTIAAALEMAESDFGRRASTSTEANVSKVLTEKQLTLLKARARVLQEANTVSKPTPAPKAAPAKVAKKTVTASAPTAPAAMAAAAK